MARRKPLNADDRSFLHNLVTTQINVANDKFQSNPSNDPADARDYVRTIDRLEDLQEKLTPDTD